MGCGGPHLEAVHLDPPLVVYVHVLLLRRRPELLVVQEVHVAHRFSHLRTQGTRILFLISIHEINYAVDMLS